MAIKRKPKFLRFEERPAGVGDSEFARAQPVYIDGLPEGGGAGNLTADDITYTHPVTEDEASVGDLLTTVLDIVSQLQNDVSALEGRVSNLEDPNGEST